MQLRTPRFLLLIGMAMWLAAASGQSATAQVNSAKQKKATTTTTPTTTAPTQTSPTTGAAAASASPTSVAPSPTPPRVIDCSTKTRTVAGLERQKARVLAQWSNLDARQKQANAAGRVAAAAALQDQLDEYADRLSELQSEIDAIRQQCG